MRRVKNKYNFLPSITMAIGLLIFALGNWIFLFFLNNDPNIIKDKSANITLNIMLGVMPFVMLILVAPKWYVILSISKEGINTKILGFIKYKYLKWEEIEEIRAGIMIGDWIFFSKRSLKDLSYNEIIKRKDCIQLAYSSKIIDIIKQFTEKDIIGFRKQGDEKQGDDSSALHSKDYRRR